jgi:hypothetical protein
MRIFVAVVPFFALSALSRSQSESFKVFDPYHGATSERMACMEYTGAHNALYLKGMEIGRLRAHREAVRSISSRVEALAWDADEEGCVIRLVLFSRESWSSGIRFGDEQMDRGVAEITRVLKPYRNVVFQVWNECGHGAISRTDWMNRAGLGRGWGRDPGFGARQRSLHSAPAEMARGGFDEGKGGIVKLPRSFAALTPSELGAASRPHSDILPLAPTCRWGPAPP